MGRKYKPKLNKNKADSAGARVKAAARKQEAGVWRPSPGPPPPLRAYIHTQNQSNPLKKRNTGTAPLLIYFLALFFENKPTKTRTSVYLAFNH
jgi:hypothetical protein